MQRGDEDRALDRKLEGTVLEQDGSPRRGHARGMLVEAAWAAARVPGPLRPFFQRVRARRGQHVVAVATARKLAVLIWHLLHKGQSYLWARPAFHARKMRNLELMAGHGKR